MSSVEPYTVPNGTPGNSAPVVSGGKRRSHKKLRLVKKKTVRRMLAKAGLKMRGGGDTGVPANETSGPVATGGRRRRHTKKTHRRRRSLFGLKY